jgi:hypothetical protein
MSRRRSRAILLAAIALTALVAACLRAVPAARADQYQTSIMMDDNLLLYSGNTTAYLTLEHMKALGVQEVRATLLWSAVARGTKNPATHRRFDPTKPGAYPRANWVPYDDLVEDAKALGMIVYFDVTGPGPAWAMGTTTDPKMKASYKPNVGQFAKFVEAVGTRYSGTYHGLGRVSVWSIWNEPNQVGWLSPQGVYSARLHAVLPYSPILYRKIWFEASHALAVTGHTTATDVILAGETAPLGSPPQNGRTPMRPGLFIREFFCVNSSLQPYRGLQASARGCGIFKKTGPVVATGWAHHPYTKAASPTFRDQSPDSIVIANINALPTLLDQIAANTQRVATGMPAYITEMGYESNPPDPFRGVSLANQAAYINQSDYLAYKNPRVAGVTQFLYEDAGPNKTFKKGTRGYWDTYQSGLVFGPHNGFAKAGTPKPALAAYRMPIWIAQAGTPASPELELWADARFTALTGTSNGQVTFEFQPQGKSNWITASLPVVPNPFGFVDITEPEDLYPAPGIWRAVWTLPGSPTVVVSRNASYPG